MWNSESSEARRLNNDVAYQICSRIDQQNVLKKLAELKLNVIYHYTTQNQVFRWDMAVVLINSNIGK
jgi:hypothetical protein